MFIYTNNEKDITTLTKRGLSILNVMEDGTHVFVLDSSNMSVGFSEDDLEDSTFTNMYHF